MDEAWLIPSAPPGAAPDFPNFPMGLDEILPRLHDSDGTGADGLAAYGTLISKAVSEVAERQGEARRRPAGCEPADKADAPRQDRRVAAFVEALFEASARSSRAIADAVFAEERDPQTLAASLFGPAARLVGERWIADVNDFLQVTVALARMQQLFARMVADSPPPAVARPDAARRLLLAPAPGEQHGFGLAVVADAFRRAGWTVDRCDDGEQLFRLVAANDYPLVGLSVGAERMLPTLKCVVERLRALSRNRSMALMAGGGVAVRHPRPLAELGFDIVAADAPSGVRMADDLVAHSMEGSHRSAFAH